MTCLVKSSNKKRTIPIIVRVSDINDNPPVFQNLPYETTVPEVSANDFYQKILECYDINGSVLLKPDDMVDNFFPDKNLTFKLHKRVESLQFICIKVN